ncbi:MAG: hypothetical protein QOD83_5023, partial [Solirubrobacteraceae bacterium]|nr:hypothetical protein [Solirubrobacteraceae bacterium]
MAATPSPTALSGRWEVDLGPVGMCEDVRRRQTAGMLSPNVIELRRGSAHCDALRRTSHRAD